MATIIKRERSHPQPCSTSKRISTPKGRHIESQNKRWKQQN
jgi:hypothetical protein